MFSLLNSQGLGLRQAFCKDLLFYYHILSLLIGLWGKQHSKTRRGRGHTRTPSVSPSLSLVIARCFPVPTSPSRRYVIHRRYMRQWGYYQGWKNKWVCRNIVYNNVVHCSSRPYNCKGCWLCVRRWNFVLIFEHVNCNFFSLILPVTYSPMVV